MGLFDVPPNPLDELDRAVRARAGGQHRGAVRGGCGGEAATVSLYHAVRTADVLAALEYWQWWLAELESDGSSDPAITEASIAFAECHLSDAIEEIERRQRLRSHKSAPPWPAGRHSALPDARLVKDALGIPTYYERMSPARRPERRGNGWVVRCDLPSHPGPDRNPSLRIAADGRLWYCDVCGVGGDLLTLHCARTGLSFRDALAELATEAGLPETEARRAG